MRAFLALCYWKDLNCQKIQPVTEGPLKTAKILKKYKTEKCFITKSVASETGQEKYVQNAKKTVKFLKKFGVDWAKTKLK